MSISANRFLTVDEMKINAYEIWTSLYANGWSINAVAGMLGNMQTESTINPGIWQDLNEGNMSGGFGLVQWTPATNYIDWAIDRGLVYTELSSNLQRILYEVEHNVQWGYSSTGQPPPYDFETFTKSTEPPYTLGMLFLIHYERPADQNQPNRGTQANFWYEYLSGEEPPVPPVTKRKRMPIYMMLRPF